MSLFAAVVGGAAGGFGGAVLAQVAVTLAHLAGIGNETLRGPWGPPFFDIAVFTGVFYAAIAGALSRRWQAALLGFLGPFLGIAVPMALLGRTMQWGWGELAQAAAADPATLVSTPWYRAVIATYTLAVWGTIGALGWRLTGRRLGSLAAVACAFAAYLLLAGVERLAPGLAAGPWRASSFFPQPTALLDGLLTGGLLGVAVIVTRRLHEKARHP